MSVLLNPPPVQSSATSALPLVLEPPRHLDQSACLLTPGQIRIGSAVDCQISLKLDGVAAEHASLIAGSQRVILKAIDPRTWLNDGPVREATLRPGDRIAIGPVIFRVRRANADDLLADWPTPAESRPTTKQQPLPVASIEPVADAQASDSAPFDPTVTATVDGPQATEDILAGWVAEPAIAAFSQPVTLISPEFAPRPSEAVHAAVSLEPLTESLAELHRQQLELAELRRELAEARVAFREDTARRTEQFAEEAIRLARQSTELTESRAALDERDRQLRSWSDVIQQREAQLLTTEAAVSARERELAAERRRLEEFAESARQELEAEVVRRSIESAEWESQQTRLLSHLAEQTTAVDEQRAALVVQERRCNEAEQELRRLRQAVDDQRHDLSRERAQLAAERTAWETERQAWQVQREREQADHRTREQRLRQLEQEIQERSEQVRRQQEQLTHDVRDRARSQAELQAFEEQLHHDRRLFTEQQSEWHRERDTAWQDITERRQRLDAETDRIVAVRHEIERLEQALEAEVHTATSERTRWQQELQSIGVEPAPEPIPDVVPDDVSEIAEAVATPSSELTADESTEAVETDSATEEDENEEPASDTAMEDIQAALDALAERFEEFSVLEHRLSIRHDELLSLQEDLAVREAELNAQRETLGLERTAWEVDRSLWDEERLAWEAACADESARRTAWEIARQNELSEWTAERQRWAAHLAELSTTVAISSPSVDIAPSDIPGDIRDESVEFTKSFGSIETEPTQTEVVTPVEPAFGSAWPTDLAAEVLPLPEALSAALTRTSEPSSEPQESTWFGDVTATEEEDTRSRPITRPRYDVPADQRDFGGEPVSFGTLEPSPVLETEPSDQPSADDDQAPASALRSELAKMFDLPGDFVRREAAEEVGPEEAAPEETAPDTTEVSQHEDWRSRLMQSLSEPSAAPVAEVASPPPVEPTSAPKAPELSEEDSITAYMERMLARNRQRTGESGDVFVAEPEPIAAAVAEPVAAPIETSAPALPPPPPRMKVDIEATRAELQSFREVANRSARSALAVHSLKTTKTELFIRSSLLLASSGGATMLLTAQLRGGTMMLWPGLGCSVAAAWMAYRVWQTWEALRRSREDVQPVSELMEAAPSPDVNERIETLKEIASQTAVPPAALPGESPATATAMSAPSVEEFAPSTTNGEDRSSTLTGSLWDNVWSDTGSAEVPHESLSDESAS